MVNKIFIKVYIVNSKVKLKKNKQKKKFLDVEYTPKKDNIVISILKLISKLYKNLKEQSRKISIYKNKIKL